MDRPSHRFDRYFGDADGVMWTIEQDPHLRLTFSALILLDRSPDWDRLRTRFDRASRRIPRLRQTVVDAPFRLAPPRWVVDPEFDLSYHLRRIELPTPHDDRALLDLCASLGMTDLDRARPLWEATLIDGLDGGRAALLLKIHHTVTDGVGGIALAGAEVFDLQREADDIDVLPDPPPVERLGRAGLAVDALAWTGGRLGRAVGRTLRRAPGALGRAVRAPAASAAGVADLVRSVGRVLAPETRTLSPVMTDRSIRWWYTTLEYPLDDVRRAAHAGVASINDAFVTAAVRGFHHYHAALGAEAPALRMTMPINIRSADDPAAGNRFLPARLHLPTSIEDPIEHMRAVREISSSWKHEPALRLLDPISAVLNRLPARVTTAVIGGMVRHDDFTASDIPGVREETFLAGSRIDRLYVLGSPSGASADVTLLSHGETACIGITVDKAAIPDGDLLRRCLDRGFQEVLALRATPAATAEGRPAAERAEP